MLWQGPCCGKDERVVVAATVVPYPVDGRAVCETTPRIDLQLRPKGHRQCVGTGAFVVSAFHVSQGERVRVSDELVGGVAEVLAVPADKINRGQTS